MNILIADDEQMIRQGIGRTLSQAWPSSQIYAASSTEEAAMILSEHPVDIVLTDILMPGMDGLEFMRISKRKHPHLQWVVISAHSDFQYAQRAVRLGAKDYLLKPIGKKKLLECVESLADEAQAESVRMKEGKPCGAALVISVRLSFNGMHWGLILESLIFSLSWRITLIFTSTWFVWKPFSARLIWSILLSRMSCLSFWNLQGMAS